MSKSRTDAAAIAIVGLLARLGVVLWAGPRFPAVEDGRYYDILARRIAAGSGYTWRWPDGVVTYVAHYPVGYPAILGAGFAIFGASVWVAMAINAALGAASVYATHRLVDDRASARWRANAAAVSVALHPALVPYTAALMTEAVTASLLVVAAALAAAARARSRRWPLLVGTGVAMGLATWIRPQSLPLAAMLGAFALPARVPNRSRVAAVALVTFVALACVLPWTARNCVRMHRCALVSVNEGWNLLIGTTTSTGAWQPVTVPAECAAVWDEAGKDSCFERAALRGIGQAPGRWLLRAPSKLAATFDYFGAAPWYLHASNAAAFGERAKTVLGGIETVACRLWLLAALRTCARLEGRRPLVRTALAILGAIGALTFHAWVGYVSIPLIVALTGWRELVRLPPAIPMASAVIAVTAAAHAVFFGAGRYGLVAAPFVAVLAFVGSVRPAPYERHDRPSLATAR